MYDVHQQLQENVLSHITLPRDISSSDIASGASSRGSSPRFMRKNSPNLPSNSGNELRPEPSPVKSRLISPSTLTKGLLSSLPKVNRNTNSNAGFNIPVPKINLKPASIVSKLKTGSAAVKMFTKETATRFSVSYNKRDEVDSVFSESSFHEPPSRRERQRTLSRDDSSIDDGSEIVEADIKEEVLLDSCGILATNTKQIFESPQYSFDDIENEHVKLVSKSCEDITSNQEVTKDGTISSDDDDDINNEKGNAKDGPNAMKMEESKDNLKTNITVNKASKERGRDIADTPTYLPRSNSEGSGFQCYCSKVETCPHNELLSNDTDEAVWQLRESQPVVDTNDADLNLGQKRVVDNSEADKILEKYSKSKQALTHPSMRISFSDGALANDAGKPVDQSPKAVLDLELEINAALQMKLPNLLESSKMSRKSQRIYDNLKKHIQERLGEQNCQSTIIFI